MTAERILPPSPPEYLGPPPATVPILLVVEKRVVVSATIEEVKEEMFGLYLARTVYTESGRKLAIIRSDYFEGAEWSLNLPRRNGKHHLEAVLIE